MAANDFNYWGDGFVFGGINDGVNVNGGMEYFDSGFPYVYIFPSSPPPSGTPRNYGFIIG